MILLDVCRDCHAINYGCLAPTSSPGRFSLALGGTGLPVPPKAKEKRPGDEVGLAPLSLHQGQDRVILHLRTRFEHQPDTNTSSETKKQIVGARGDKKNTMALLSFLYFFVANFPFRFSTFRPLSPLSFPGSPRIILR